MGDLVIKGGTVVDSEGERRADVVIDEQGAIAAIGADLTASSILDADACVVTSGLVDLRARLGEPGREQAETIETATRSAVLGGYTAVVAMPDTDPVADCASVVRDVRQLASSGLCHVEVAGAITVGTRGEALAEMGEMAAAGVSIFSDSQHSLQRTGLLRRAMEYAAGLGVTLSLQCQDEALAAGGHMNEGAVSSRLGVPGIPAEAEELAVMRDVALGRLTGARIHLQALSTAGSIGIARASRAQGLRVSADVTPNHLVLTDATVSTYDARFKVAPPLRTPDDIAHLRAALAEGAVDAIATDHWRHEPQGKEMPFDLAPCGAVGLETALAVVMTELDLSLTSILALMSWNPAAIAGLESSHGGHLGPGRPANLVVIDPTDEWVVPGADRTGRALSSPFEGRRLVGRARHTIVNGEAVVIDGEAQR